ncbi:class I SAM-dependent methyltransferase [Alphaproteobacteria bacterium LSUCC0684]
MTSVFDKYSAYYDLLYKDKNYKEETNYIYELLNKFGVSSGGLLEFGSGTGIHARMLGDLGYYVHGIEMSHGMVARASVNEQFSCQQGDITKVKLNKKFDAVLSLFHVMSYLSENQALNSAFRNAADHLNPGGIFIFDFWYLPAVLTQKPDVRVKRMADDKLEVTRIAEPVMKENSNIVEVNYEVFVRSMASGDVENFSESHNMRYLSLPEIDLFAKNNGFERILSEEFLTGYAPSSSTWGVCVALRKI